MSAVTPAGGDTAAGRSWPLLLNGLLNGQDLTADDTAWAMDLIMRGEATDAQIAGFAVALRAKLSNAYYGEDNQIPKPTVEEYREITSGHGHH